ncbi:MAG: hypothetical protein M0Z41_20105 [Peptococcaceae bacterium]|jgi:superoxide dismutase|nr:hypothetical protein [Peptococcaceae bacterium]
MDQLESMENHKTTAQHYCNNANKLMEAGEIQKASELYWGFIAQEILAFAATKERNLGTHRQFVEFCTDLSKATEDPYFKDEFKALYNALHVDFYHLMYEMSEISDFAIRARHFVERLWSLEEK